MVTTLVAESFEAVFSANSNMWTITTEEFEIEVRYLNIEGHNTGEKRLAAETQVVKGEWVFFILKRDHIVIKKWRGQLEKKHLWDLYNPDTPRNLAKVVTVK